MDPFLRQQAIPTQPVESGLAVTPNDGANLVPPNGDPAKATRALLVGSTGTVKVDMADGTTVTFTVPATACGFIQGIAIKKVYATGTTATGIVAFY
jgi:hypothetical protein